MNIEVKRLVAHRISVLGENLEVSSLTSSAALGACPASLQDHTAQAGAGAPQRQGPPQGSPFSMNVALSLSPQLH